jgi:AraC-like DNA-binding protein
MAAALAWNLMLRGGAVALLLLLAGALWRERPPSAASRLGAAFAVGTAATAIGSMPGFGDAYAWWHVPIAALAAGNMWVFWLFTRALLDDGYTPRHWHALGWIGLAALGAAECAIWVPSGAPFAGPVSTALTATTIALALLSVAQSLATWREDLVERRRRVRMVIVSSAAAFAVLTALAALIAGGDAKAVFSSTGNAFGLAALSLVAAWQLLRLRMDELLAPGRPAEPVASVTRPAVDPAPAAEADPQRVAQLDRLMAIERAYREPELGIGALASRMAMPEHQLRRLINQGLGYRNFSAFLNGYRIAEAKHLLADAQRADVAILTIAMDAGFRSIGPFNRAFKESTGLTPSDYRRRALANAPPARAVVPAETEIG